MSEKKDPHQKNGPLGVDDDDDDIIELTNEVILKPRKDDESMDLQGPDRAVPRAPAHIPAKTAKKEPKSADDEFIELDGSPESESETEGAGLNLDEAFADDENSVDEDDIIASAIAESLGDDEEDFAQDSIKLNGRADTSDAKDVEEIMLDRGEDEPGALSGHDAGAAEMDEGVFEGEEEIELEYESSEDEYDFFALDDEKPLEELEILTMADEAPDGVADDGERFDPAAKLGLNSDEDHGIIAMESEPQSEARLMAFDGEDTMEFDEAGDLPELTDELEFEFDDEDEKNGFAAIDNHAVEDRDDIIARAVEKPLAPDEVTARIDQTGEPGFDFTANSDIMAEDDKQARQEDLTAITAEEIRELAEADDLDDIDDDIDLEFEDEAEIYDREGIAGLESEIETLAIDELEDSTAEEDDDIIEITEFDEHIPADDERKLARAGVLDASGSDEDDFLELIEVEEDDMSEDQEVIAFSRSEEQVEEDEIDSFFSEALEDEPVFEDEEMASFEETPVLSTDMALATATPDGEEEEFDFSLDSREISQQVDRLDSFLSDDSTPEQEVASLPAEQLTEEGSADEKQPADEEPTESLSLSTDQVDAILERVIKDKFGGNIESIIYEVIQKAVSKEIDRLKGALLNDGGSGRDDDE